MRLLVVVATELRAHFEIVESAEPPRAVALEVIRALRRRGHRFGDVRAVQVLELGDVCWSVGPARDVEGILESWAATR